ncbi:uncharacterized protein LOC142329497 [Lycorma delicatula]|uniref:uncharacterized protein LOC142329497 n=1 Tax=Lycorma delicatula TaxID=130591 RepID=UPI003F518270
MPLMQSCCCWRSLRKGSYASAVYTLGYFSLIVVIIFNFLLEESSFWSENAVPRSPSFLEPEISPTSMIFALAVLVCALFGVVSSILLAYGVYMDKRALLIPWILTVITTTMIDISHAVYLFALDSVRFNPGTALLFTLDFFLLSLNMYCLVCVVSQYQEYKAGRGMADQDNQIIRPRSLAIPQVKFKCKKKTENNSNVTTIQRDKKFVEKKSVVAVDGCSKLHVSAGMNSTQTPQKQPPPRPVNHCKPLVRKHVQFRPSSDLLLYQEWDQSNTLDKGCDMGVVPWPVPSDESPNNIKLDEEPLIVDTK